MYVCKAESGAWKEPNSHAEAVKRQDLCEISGNQAPVKQRCIRGIPFAPVAFRRETGARTPYPSTLLYAHISLHSAKGGCSGNRV